MKKNAMTAALVAAMTLALPFAAQAADIQSEYAALLAPYTDNLDKYALYDITGDGILDLIIDPGVTNPAKIFDVYSYDGTTSRSLGNVSARGSELCVDGAGKLVRLREERGYIMIYDIVWNGSALVETERYTGGITNKASVAAAEASFGIQRIEYPTADKTPLSTLTVSNAGAQAAQASGSGWIQDAAGWKYGNGDGSFKQTGWFQDVDGSYYYFGADGYMLSSTTTPDGYQVDASGRWVK